MSTSTSNTTVPAVSQPTKAANPISTECKDTEMSHGNPDMFFKQGKAEMKAMKYKEAVQSFSSALELLEKTAKDNRAELAKYYLNYGESLLRYSQEQNDLINNDGPATQDPINTQKEKSTTNGAQEPAVTGTTTTTAAEPNTTSTSTTTSVTNSKEKASEAKSDETQEKTVSGEKENENSVNGQKSSGEASDEYFVDPDALNAMMVANSSEDRELAWTSFESARVHLTTELEKNAKNTDLQKMLADTHSLEAELHFENGMFEESVKEYENAIQIRQEYDANNARELAFLHYMAYLAAVYGSLFEAREKHLDLAFEVICTKLIEILNGLGQSLESEADADTILQSIDSVKKDKKTYGSMADGAKKELSDLEQSLLELIEKAEEGPTAQDDQVMEAFRTIMAEGGLEGLMSSKLGEEEAQQAVKVPQEPVPFETEMPEQKSDDTEEEVHNLGTFGSIGKKRSREEAGMNGMEELEPPSKKSKTKEKTNGFEADA